MILEDTSYRYHTEPNGCPTRIFTSNGNVAWSALYNIWGNIDIHVEKVDNPLRMQGQYYDQETGLYYNRFRYYDPDAGQFISQDPIGLVGGTNVYQYAPNSLNWTDPLGLSYRKGTEKGANELRMRAEELHRIPKKPKLETVTAIRGVNRKTGEVRTFIAKEGTQKTPPARWGQLKEGEEWVPGIKQGHHAEENILRNPKLKDWDFLEGGTSRNICGNMDHCGAAIPDKGLSIGGPDFPGRAGTTKRMFWKK
jgi:RHS repeat-associated protein